MILYFTGTGNSRYVAERISRAIGEKPQALMKRIKDKDFSELHSETPWVICTPTYGWQMPHVVRDWLRKTNLTGSRSIYFVLTCGGAIGNAGKYAEKLAAEKGMNDCGIAEIIMPENYVAMFDVPEEAEAREIIARAEPSIDQVIRVIQSGGNLEHAPAGFVEKVESGVVNAVYYPLLIHSRKFYAKDSCIGCGLCEKLCPVNAIKMEDGRPFWDGNCTHCMACISHCPAAAIEYGKKSVGKPRYLCPLSSGQKEGKSE